MASPDRGPGIRDLGQGRVSPATGRIEVGSNPSTHPLVGNHRENGIAAAWLAEELQHAAIEPGVFSVKAPSKGPFIQPDPELEKGLDWV